MIKRQGQVHFTSCVYMAAESGRRWGHSTVLKHGRLHIKLRRGIIFLGYYLHVFLFKDPAQNENTEPLVQRAGKSNIGGTKI